MAKLVQTGAALVRVFEEQEEGSVWVWVAVAVALLILIGSCSH